MQKNNEEDLLRDSWIRYFGYAKEIGYSLHCVAPYRISPNVAYWSYHVVLAYVLVDVVDKGLKRWKASNAKTETSSYSKIMGCSCADSVKKGQGLQGPVLDVLTTAGDALIWQNIASIIVPGLLLNRLREYTCEAISCRYPFTRLIPPTMRCAVTLGVGLAAIPLIVGPIDFGAHFFMNNTYRKIFDSSI